MQAPYLSLNSVSASYDENKSVISDISFALNEGELGCLLGPSGCGKTTILRTISGFQPISSGSIALAGREISTSGSVLAPEHRNVGMVFQDHALFPHLNIAENVGFGIHTWSKPKREKQVTEMLDLVGMRALRDAYPHEISGGQSQRVALARALAPQPSLLLMDEPFSNLDASLRESLGYEVRQLLKETGITAIMVTHDQHDAFALADKIGVIANGGLEQWGSSFDLYHAPASRFVANFVGDGVFLNGRLISRHAVSTDVGEIHGSAVNTAHIGQRIELLLRPDDVQHSVDGDIHAKVTRKAFKGAQTLYTVETYNGLSLMSLIPSHDNFEIGEEIRLTIEAEHLVSFLSD